MCATLTVYKRKDWLLLSLNFVWERVYVLKWRSVLCCCRSRLWLPFHCVLSYYTISITPNVCVTHLSLPCFLPQAKNSSYTWIRFGERVSPPRPKPGQQDCRDGRWQECSGHRNIFHWYESINVLLILLKITEHIGWPHPQAPSCLKHTWEKSEMQVNKVERGLEMRLMCRTKCRLGQHNDCSYSISLNDNILMLTDFMSLLCLLALNEHP